MLIHYEFSHLLILGDQEGAGKINIQNTLKFRIKFNSNQLKSTWQLLSDCLNVREVMAEHPASTNPARVTCLIWINIMNVWVNIFWFCPPVHAGDNKRQNSKFSSSISFNLVISSESFNYLQTLHNHISFLITNIFNYNLDTKIKRNSCGRPLFFIQIHTFKTNCKLYDCHNVMPQCNVQVLGVECKKLNVGYLGIIDENCLDMFKPSFINNLLTILISDGKGSNAR